MRPRPGSVLMLIGADDAQALHRRLRAMHGAIASIQPAELVTFARSVSRNAPRHARLRAAVLGSNRDMCKRRLAELSSWLETPAPDTRHKALGKALGVQDQRASSSLRAGRGLFLGSGCQPARVGFLFPGQGSAVSFDAGALGELCADVRELYASITPAEREQHVTAACVQLAVVLSSLAALCALHALGVRAEVAVGHSLGELTALHWAGAIDRPTLLEIARVRGHAMTAHVDAGGAMAAIHCDEHVFTALISEQHEHGSQLTPACLNSPDQRVVSGPADAITALLARAEQMGVKAIPLNVTGAFHSPLMSRAVPVFERFLATTSFAPVQRRVVSTITGEPLDAHTDLRALLCAQIEQPVRFAQAARAVALETDLLIEVGPGQALARLMPELGTTPAVSIRAGERSANGMLETLGATYAAGCAAQIPDCL